MLNPLFKSQPLEILDFNQMPVSISYKFKSTDKVITKELFPVGTSFPSTKSITFDSKQGGVDLLIHYSNNTQMLNGLPNQIA